MIVFTRLSFVVFLAGLAAGCSSGESESESTTGGTGALGGTGGSALPATGGIGAGTPASGGSGATPSSGGAVASGGSQASGGSVESTTGGMGSGGLPASGGMATGGASPTGGRPSGGSFPSGGASATGGGSSVGGDPTTGGNLPTGGNSTTGGSSGDFEISVHLASDENAQAPGTIGIVEWSVIPSDITEAHIDFGLDTTYGMVAPVDLDAGDLRTLLLGLKPSHEYHFRVVASTGTATYTSDDTSFMTGPPTDLVSVADFQVIDESARERGFIITEFFQLGTGGPAQGRGLAFIIDPDGDIVWWHQSSISSMARARMSADGKNMWLIASGLQGGALERVTMDTLEVETYPVVASHDITPVVGETMAYLDYGESDCDSIFEIDPSGTATEIFESQGVTSGQCHGNALRYSATEDVYTFSDHRVDVFVVDRTGDVRWRLSELVGPNSTWGGSQHGHHLLDDSILIFANDGGTRGAAAIEFDLDGNEISRYDPGISTSNLGDVQRLPGGNTLITFSTSSIIHEYDASGAAVLTIDMGQSLIGYASWRASLYGPPSDTPL